ncbi:hypothetical protein LguiA_004169 [Lonicera macranthoides]
MVLFLKFKQWDMKHLAILQRPSAAATPLRILMYPSSPHPVPHEFFTNQYFVPYPKAVTPWSSSVPLSPVKTPLE